MKPASPFRHLDSSPEVIRLVQMFVRFLLGLWNVEDLLFERDLWAFIWMGNPGNGRQGDHDLPAYDEIARSGRSRGELQLD